MILVYEQFNNFSYEQGNISYELFNTLSFEFINVLLVVIVNTTSQMYICYINEFMYSKYKVFPELHILTVF